ncbi:MAG: translocation/assembly module TamB domain-containing protein, partial [Saprospiraceae bacterium]|nr:translocation/assembly module TamB domain-containing protein [Saprospiraceae bacterium]
MNLRRPFKILLKSLAALLLLLALLLFVLHQPATQRWLTPKLEDWLAQKLKTELQIGGVGVRFPKMLEIKDLQLKTPEGDSLLQVGSLAVDLDMWALLDQQVVLQKIGLENADVRLRQTNGKANFDFILDAFSTTESTPKPDSTGGFQLLLDGAALQLHEVDFSFDDLDNQQFIGARVGDLKLKLKAADLEKLRFEASDFTLSDSKITYRDRSTASPDSSAATVFGLLLRNASIENSQIAYENKDLKLDANWHKTALTDFALNLDEQGVKLSAPNLELENSDLAFSQSQAKPTPGSFNAADFEWKNLNAQISDFKIENDAIQLKVEQLSGEEKSGISIQKLAGELAYSPAALDVKKLDFQANTTSLKGDFNLQFGREGQPPLSNFKVNLGASEGKLGDLLKFLPPDPSLADLKQMKDTRWAIKGGLQGDMKNLKATNLDFSFGKYTYLRCNGTLTQIADLQRIGGNLQITALQFDKDDFTPFLKGKNWMLPAYAVLSGRVAGQSGALNLDVKGSFGNLDSLAFAPVLSDTAYFDLAGNLSGFTSTKSLRFDLDLRRLEARGEQFADFVPKSIQLPDLMSATGKLKGSLADLNADLKLTSIRDNRTSKIAIIGDLFQLDQADSLGIDLAYRGIINKHELTAFVPDSVLNQYLDLPQYFTVEGKAKGKPTDLVADLLLGLGRQGNLKLEGSLNGEKYKADIVGNGLKINELMADSLVPQLENLSLSMQLEGDGFDVKKTAKAKLSGQIKSLTWEGKNFEDIALDGNLNAGKFAIDLKSPDPRLNLVLTANGAINEALPILNWTAFFNCLDLKALGFSEKTATACFKMDGFAYGNSLDTLDASVTLDAIDIQLDTLRLKPTKTTLNAELHNDENRIVVLSEWLSAELKGHFDLTQLPQWADAFRQHYFKTNAANVQTMDIRNDQIWVNLSVTEPSFFTSGLVPGLSGLKDLKLEGFFNGQTNRFHLNTNLPLASYDGWTVEGLEFTAKGNGQTADYALKIPKVEQYDEAFVRDLNLTGDLNGERATALLTALDSLGKERFKVGLFADAESFKEGYTLHFNPSQLLDYQSWTIDAENSLSIAGQDVSIKKFYLNNGEQSLRLDGKTALQTDGQRSLDFEAKLRQLRLDNFTAFLKGILDNPVGLLDGDLTLGGTMASPRPDGELQLNGVAATIATTGVRYKLSDKALVFTKDGLDLTGLTLTDPRSNLLTINGLLRTTNWADLRYDLQIASKRWQVMDTHEKPGVEYFGKLYAGVSGTVRGPLAQPDINLTAKPLSGSKLSYIYDDAASSADGNGLVVFVSKDDGKKTKPKAATSQKYPFHLNMNLEMNDSLKLKVVTDPGTGDSFEGELDGRLSLEIFPDGKMNLAGRCYVKKGVYHYSY